MSMVARGKTYVMTGLMLATLLATALLMGAGCKKNDEISLAYEKSSIVPVIRARTFGGMPAPWDDEAPWFTLYGDGTVITRGEGGATAPLQRGKMARADVDTLLERIRDAGFFDLETYYRDVDVYDYVFEAVEVIVQERSQSVTVYYEKVDAFTATLDAIAAAPVSALEDYVPGRGYLVVRTHTTGDKDVVVEEGSEAYGLLPDASVLAWAASENQPLAVSGKDFAVIKRYAADRDAAGLVLKGEGGDLILYPVYEPR
jgi:hypothetical protein